MSTRVLTLFLGLCASLPAFGAIRVVDPQGHPLAGAKVLVGEAVNQPFPGNQFVTDDNGEFQAPRAWTAPLPVTIEGTDLVRTTHFAVAPTAERLMVSHADGDGHIQLSGTLTNYGDIRTDGKVDVGVFVPTMAPADLLYFDVTGMISPETDSISIIGKEIAVPSNITLPRQSESYIFPITLDKPNFRMFVRKPGPYRFLALHGQFPLKRVVDDLRAKVPPYDVINHVTLVQTGLVNVNVNGNVSGLSVPVNQFPFNNRVSIKAPSLNSDDIVLSVAFSKIDDSGALVPSDVKRIASNQTLSLRTPAAKSTPMALSAWVKKTAAAITPQGPPLPEPLDPVEVMKNLPEDLIYSIFRAEPEANPQGPTVDYNRVSLATHNEPGQAPAFIGHVNPPEVAGTKVKLMPPSADARVNKTATLLVYSEIKNVGQGKFQIQQRNRLWEIWLPGWATEAVLPNLAALPTAGNAHRWEVLYLGRSGNGMIRAGGQDITHVSRNSRDL
jgi:hypothetical protein